MFSKKEEQHKIVFNVLDALQSRNLKLKVSKCEFFKSEDTFLGSFIFKDGHSISQDKLKAVQYWEALTNKTEVWAFLGTVNFIRKFCKDLSNIALPLSRLTSPKIEFIWNSEHQNAFESIKNFTY